MHRRRLLQALGMGAAASGVVAKAIEPEPESMHPYQPAFLIKNDDGGIVFSISKAGKMLEGLHPTEPAPPKPKPKPKPEGVLYFGVEPNNTVSICGDLTIEPAN